MSSSSATASSVSSSRSTPTHTRHSKSNKLIDYLKNEHYFKISSVIAILMLLVVLSFYVPQEPSQIKVSEKQENLMKINVVVLLILSLTWSIASFVLRNKKNK